MPFPACRHIRSSKAVHVTLRLLAVTALSLAAVPGHAHDAASVAPANASATAANRAQAEALTQSLVDLTAQYSAAGASDRSRIQSVLVATAARRRQLFESIIDNDPGAVLDAALPVAIRATLPSTVGVYLEQDAIQDGELEVYHVDHVDVSRSGYRYFLKTPEGRLSLHFADIAPSLPTGTEVHVRGVRVNDALALGGGNSVKQVRLAPAPNTIGDQRTLIILVNFQDNAVQPYTLVDAQAVVFGTTSNFFLENSYGQTWLSGDAVGWFTIAASTSVCDTGAIATQAQAAATAAGVNVGAYAHLVYAFPQNACGWWGMSTVGGTPSQSWIDGDLQLAVSGHELGHALGLWHSHAIDCGAQTIGAACDMLEYGDVFDKMGGSTYPGHFNSFQKERLGWLNAGVSPPITTVQASGTYTLETYEMPGSGAKALKILKSTDPTTGYRTWYYVEARKPVGFDNFLASVANTASNGVLIRTGSESDGNSSNLLDMTPATDTSIWDWLVDAPLVAGQSYADPDTGITIATAWSDSAGAAVTVNLGGTVSTATTLVISTDQGSYTRTQSVAVTARLSGPTSVAGTPVTFSVQKSDGSILKATVTTDTTGKAVYKLKLGRKDPTGTYDAMASALTDRAETTFVVK
jgi:hypothetical protein